MYRYHDFYNLLALHTEDEPGCIITGLLKHQPFDLIFNLNIKFVSRNSKKKPKARVHNRAAMYIIQKYVKSFSIINSSPTQIDKRLDKHQAPCCRKRRWRHLQQTVRDNNPPFGLQ